MAPQTTGSTKGNSTTEGTGGNHSSNRDQHVVDRNQYIRLDMDDLDSRADPHEGNTQIMDEDGNITMQESTLGGVVEAGTEEEDHPIAVANSGGRTQVAVQAGGLHALGEGKGVRRSSPRGTEGERGGGNRLRHSSSADSIVNLLRPRRFRFAPSSWVMAPSGSCDSSERKSGGKLGHKGGRDTGGGGVPHAGTPLIQMVVKDPPLKHQLHRPHSSSNSSSGNTASPRRHHPHHRHCLPPHRSYSTNSSHNYNNSNHKHIRHFKGHAYQQQILFQQHKSPHNRPIVVQQVPSSRTKMMESQATLCSTLEQEDEDEDPEVSDSDEEVDQSEMEHQRGSESNNSAVGGGQRALVIRTGSGGHGAVGSGNDGGSGQMQFGEVSVPESMLLHNSDHKAYYSFVNPALVPSLTDFQMQAKVLGRDEWYADSDGLAHLYEVPTADFAIKDSPDMVPVARRAMKNLIVLSLAFMFVLTAFVSLQTLQSSMNHADGLGVVSLSCVYASTVFSCLLAPAVIKRLTTKWTLVLAFSLFLIYIGCNFYPIVPVVIPASVLLGLLTGPLWSAQATYLTTLAIQYASAHKQLQDTTINRFNGIFMSIVQTSQVWGNLVSTLVLSHDNFTTTVNKALSQANLMGPLEGSMILPSPAAAVILTPSSTGGIVLNTSMDGTTLINGVDGGATVVSSCTFRCGALDCGVHDFPDVEAVAGLPSIKHTVAHVPTNVRMLLLGVQLACAITGVVLVAVLLDRNSMNTTDAKYPGSLSSGQLFSATLKMFKDTRLQLLLPLVMFTGLEQGFVFGEFTKSYVNCALGIHKIGSVMMCFGAMTALTALFIGAISRHIKRFAIMTSGTLFNTGLLIVLLWWKPRHDDLPMFYVIASCLGLCDAIWQTQTNTLFGVLFTEKQEAGFASYRMFQAIGFAVSFGYSYYLCVSTKVYIMTGVLLVALLLYSIIEFRLYQQARTRDGVVVL